MITVIIYDDYIVPDADFDYELEGEPYKPKGGLAMCDIKEESIPDKYKELINKTFTIYGKNNQTTQVKILSYHVLADYTPHFGEYQQWEAEGLSDKEITRNVFSGGQAAEFIVAKIDKKLDYSLSYSWARLASLPEVGFPNNSCDDAFETNTKNNVHNSMEYSTVEDGYRDYVKNAESEESEEDFSENWEDYAYYSWYYCQTDKVNVAFFYSYSGEPCGMESYEAEVSAVFTAEKTTKKGNFDINEMLNEYGIPIASLDYDNDGYPEFVFLNSPTHYRVVKYINGELIEIQELIIPYFDCPC